MNLDLLEIILILWLIERITVERIRYKLAIDTNNHFLKDGYWSIWIYSQDINERCFNRETRLIHFTKFINPHIG